MNKNKRMSLLQKLAEENTETAEPVTSNEVGDDGIATANAIFEQIWNQTFDEEISKLNP